MFIFACFIFLYLCIVKFNLLVVTNKILIYYLLLLFMCVTIVICLLISLLPCCKHKSPVSENLMFSFKQRKLDKEEVDVEDDDNDTKL